MNNGPEMEGAAVEWKPGRTIKLLDETVWINVNENVGLRCDLDSLRWASRSEK